MQNFLNTYLFETFKECNTADEIALELFKRGNKGSLENVNFDNPISSLLFEKHGINTSLVNPKRIKCLHNEEIIELPNSIAGFMINWTHNFYPFLSKINSVEEVYSELCRNLHKNMSYYAIAQDIASKISRANVLFDHSDPRKNVLAQYIKFQLPNAENIAVYDKYTCVDARTIDNPSAIKQFLEVKKGGSLSPILSYSITDVNVRNKFITSQYGYQKLILTMEIFKNSGVHLYLLRGKYICNNDQYYIVLEVKTAHNCKQTINPMVALIVRAIDQKSCLSPYKK